MIADERASLKLSKESTLQFTPSSHFRLTVGIHPIVENEYGEMGGMSMMDLLGGLNGRIDRDHIEDLLEETAQDGDITVIEKKFHAPAFYNEGWDEVSNQGLRILR